MHSVFLNGKGLPVSDVVDGSRIRLDNLQAENRSRSPARPCTAPPARACTASMTPPTASATCTRSMSPPTRAASSRTSNSRSQGRVHLHVMAPSEWQVSSNGIETLRTQLTSDPATSRWDFAPTKPMSTYITTVLAGPYFKPRTPGTGASRTNRAGRAAGALLPGLHGAVLRPGGTVPSDQERPGLLQTTSSITHTRGESTSRHSCPSTTSAPWRTRDW